MRKILKPTGILIFGFWLLLLSLSHPTAWAVESIVGANAVVSWTNPTTTVDGAPLKDLAGILVWVGTETQTYSIEYNVGLVSSIPISVLKLTDGQFYIALQAYDSNGYISSLSNEFAFVLQTSSTKTTTSTIITKPTTTTTTTTTTTPSLNRFPSVGSLTPVNITTAPGVTQSFTGTYSDPDGWQNIAEDNFYLSGNRGVHNEWLRYFVAPNLFTMMGSNDTCSPGQAKTLSSGYLTLDCSTSSISGSGTTLTVIFQVTPQMSSSGIQYNIFTAASDQAAAGYAIFAGTWKIP